MFKSFDDPHVDLVANVSDAVVIFFFSLHNGPTSNHCRDLTIVNSVSSLKILINYLLKSP